MEELTLPVGVFFDPTEEEILFYYLRRKLRRQPLPPLVKDCDLYGDKNPWELFDKTCTESIYVFAKLKKKSNLRIDRTAGCGTWDGRLPKKIKDKDDSKKVVGFDKYFVFLVKDPSRTDMEANGHWTMHEFSLLNEQFDDYVLCVIRNNRPESKKRKLNQGQENQEAKKRRATSTMDNIDIDDKRDTGDASHPPSNLISEPTAELELASSSDLNYLPPSNPVTEPAPALYMEPTSKSCDNYTAYDPPLPQSTILQAPMVDAFYRKTIEDIDAALRWVDMQERRCCLTPYIM